MNFSSQQSSFSHARSGQACGPIPMPMELFEAIDEQEIEVLRRAWSSGYLGGNGFSWNRFNNIRTGV